MIDIFTVQGRVLYKKSVLSFELLLSPGQTIVKFQRTISQHCWHNMLHTLGHPVAICCDMLRVVGSSLKMVKFSGQRFNMLHDVVLVWPPSRNIVALEHAH